jgi:hypothetical protein
MNFLDAADVRDQDSLASAATRATLIPGPLRDHHQHPVQLACEKKHQVAIKQKPVGLSTNPVMEAYPSVDRSWLDTIDLHGLNQPWSAVSSATEFNCQQGV